MHCLILACIAHKSLEIFERCRLRQQNPPATPNNLLRSSSYGASATGKRSRHSEATADSAAFLDRGVEIHILNLNMVLTRNWENDPSRFYAVDGELQRAWRESLCKSERIGAAFHKKKANAASKVVTANVPTWLEVVDGKIVERPEMVETVREVFRLAANGVGIYNIRKQLNGSLNGRSESWVLRTLRSRAVLGEYQPRFADGKPDGDVVPNYYPAIIDVDVFEEVKENLDARRRNHAFEYRRGDRTSDRADNLFKDLMYDLTAEPEAEMHFQRIEKKTGKVHTYLYSSERKEYRIRYAPFEAAMLRFFIELDDHEWKAIAGEGEPVEVTAAAQAVNRVSLELDQVTRALAVKESALEMSVDLDETQNLNALVTKLKKKAAALSEQKEALSARVAAPRAKSGKLFDSESLKQRIRKSADNDTRLRLRTAIRDRIARIEFTFNFELIVAGDVQDSLGRSIKPGKGPAVGDNRR
jgi:hypothetical protein